MEDNLQFWFERESRRQQRTERGVTSDGARVAQIYSLLDHSRRSELIQFATRLLLSQQIDRCEKKTVAPDSDEVSDAIDALIDETKPYDDVGQMLSILNDYTCNVDEAFFPDGKEDVIVRCSLEDRELGEAFVESYRCAVELARDYSGATNLLTQDEFFGIVDDDEYEGQWKREQQFEGWIATWRNHFFYELFGRTDPDRVLERWKWKEREKARDI